MKIMIGHKFLVPILLFFISANAFAQEPLVQCGNAPDDPCTWDDLMALIQTVFDFGLKYVAIPIAVIMIAWGGITMAISAGNESKFKQGRDIITATAIGLVIIFAAWLIINTVVGLLGINAAPTS